MGVTPCYLQYCSRCDDSQGDGKALTLVERSHIEIRLWHRYGHHHLNPIHFVTDTSIYSHSRGEGCLPTPPNRPA